jgi:hypothetical protein
VKAKPSIHLEGTTARLFLGHLFSEVKALHARVEIGTQNAFLRTCKFSGYARH